MRPFTLFLMTFIFAISSYGVTVVSDLDDTIKITHVKAVQAIKRTLTSTDVFLGMSKLMQVFKEPSANKLYIVTGSFDLVRGPVNKLLSYNGIEADHVYLANGPSNKAGILDTLIGSIQDDVILLGDDQEHDPQIYEAVQRKYGQKIKAIYIHQLNIVNLPPGQIGYLSAYEVALHEAQAGRLTALQADQVKNFITRNLDFRKFIPFYASKTSKLLIPHWQECTADSVSQVLAPTRNINIADQNFLNRVEQIALKNCDD